MITIDVIGQLIPNPMTMLAQLCSTLVLFLFVKKFLWTSVTKFLDARSAAMQMDLKQRAEARKEAEADRESRIRRAAGEAQAIKAVADAKEENA